jgi:hypothetical protein
MKIGGPARVFCTSHPEMMADDITYECFKELMIERFRDKSSAQFHYVRMQVASQVKNENPEIFWIASERCVSGRSVLVTTRGNGCI